MADGRAPTTRPSPAAVEAERALLGGLILHSGSIPGATEILGPEDFYRFEHGLLFKLLADMHGRGEAIDMITVPERVARDGQQDRYGGVAYVVELPDQVPATANLGHYAAVIREKSLLRQVIQATTRVSEEAYAHPDDVTGMIDRAANELLGLGKGNGKAGGWQRISEILDGELIKIQTLSERKDGGPAGYTTGFEDLDKKLAGLHKTDLLVLAARPAMGKTALALNMAQNVALLAERPVGMFSLEMSRGQLVTRMLCCHALVDAGRVRTGTLQTDDWQRLLDADDYLRRARVFIDDTPNLSIGDVRSRARRLHSEHPDLGLVVVDYLQLMRGDDPRASREQQISAISRGLKILAKELEVPVIALSQLNRGVESRQEKRPMVSDLRESGAIEQDADVILFIYRDELYNKDTADKGVAEIIIAKQRNGPTGTVRLAFQGEYTRFDNLAEGPLRLA
jgi:replicative DNA helicase